MDKRLLLLIGLLMVAGCQSNVQGKATVVNNAAFMSQTQLPSTICTGTQTQVYVTMINTGTTTWNASAGYKLGSQNPGDNTNWGTGRVPVSGNVKPSAYQNLAYFQFNIRAQAKPGTYNYQWKMLREGVEWFGASSPNQVVVVKDCTTPSSSPACTDSDGGREYRVTGRTCFQGNCQTDYCLSTSQLIEFFCTTNAAGAPTRNTEVYSCGAGNMCINGTCLR